MTSRVDASSVRTAVSTPIGELLLTANAFGLTGIHFEKRWPTDAETATLLDAPDDTILREARTQLDEYFVGGRRAFSLPLSLGGTSFQQQVWEMLQQVQFGETTSYRSIAERIGNPRAVRAVGAANRQNPVPIVVPCHRIIGATGSLVGFGGGLACKRWLLEHEGALTPELMTD
jgi:methylated-DNA-[protein]-cysteine S-methyltransferase